LRIISAMAVTAGHTENAGAALPPIGMIAGGGRLPIAAARGIRAAGRSVCCVGLADQYEDELPGLCDAFRQVGLVQVGKWARVLRRWGCEEAVLLGKVRKTRMYDPLLWLRYRPDFTAAKIWFWRLRSDKRADSMLGAVADELQADGITLIDSTKYISQCMADEGVMGKAKPTAANEADIAFALPIVHRMGDLDIGQAIAVADRDVLAVEAIEGTDAMIERAGALCTKGKWTLIKVAKPNQDMRFDVPTVGPRTIEKLAAHRANCLAVEAGRTIVLDREKMIAAADAAGIAVVGVRLRNITGAG